VLLALHALFWHLLGRPDPVYNPPRGARADAACARHTPAALHRPRFTGRASPAALHRPRFTGRTSPAVPDL